MTAPTAGPAEILIRHAWAVHRQDPDGWLADCLHDAVWALEEAADLGVTDLTRLARRVVQALASATGDDEVLAPMPTVAAWLELDQ